MPALQDIMILYNNVQWTAYTANPDILKEAIAHSLKVWTVWDDNLMVGLARVVGMVQPLSILRIFWCWKTIRVRE